MTRRVKFTRQNLRDRVKIAYGKHLSRVDSIEFTRWRPVCTRVCAMRFAPQSGTVPTAIPTGATPVRGLAGNHGTTGRKTLISRDNLDSDTPMGDNRGLVPFSGTPNECTLPLPHLSRVTSALRIGTINLLPTGSIGSM